MLKQLRIAFILLVTSFAFTTNAQIYPVQTTIVTTGPYYNYLSYYADQNNHLQAIVTLTDFNSGPIQARLRVRIEGSGFTVQTNPNQVVGTPFILEPGVPVFLSGIDLQAYFAASNLIKSPNSLDLQNLPGANFTICIDVVRDAVNQEVLSTNNCRFVQLDRFQVPEPLPINCGQELDTSSLFHTFQWTPALGYVPQAGFDLNYTFSLYEWVDPTNYTIFQTGQGLIWQEVTTFNQVQISSFDVVMQPGMQYVWRVQAEVTDNGNPIFVFENNGLSEPCTFTYGPAPSLEGELMDGLYIDLNAEANTQYKGRAYWTVIDNTPGQGLSTFDQYVVEYRKKPDSNAPNPQWHQDTVLSFSRFIYQLSPETTYEVRVFGMAGNFLSDPSNTAEFTTPAAVDYACGDQQQPFLPSNYTPLENATAGIQVSIGQFMMTVSYIVPNGAPGHYQGKGTIPIGFLADAKAKVSFSDILIDNEYVVREGRVDVVTDGLDAWLHEQYQQFIDPIYVDGTIDSAWVDTTAGVAWVIVDGVSQQFVFDPPDYPIIINDASGYQWTIYPNGTITVSSYLDLSNDHLDVTAANAGHFKQNDAEIFGFDGKQHMEWHENYEVILLSDSTHYFVPNKSIGKDATDVVNIELPAGVASPTFKLDDATAISASPFGGGQGGGNVYTVSLPQIQQSGEHAVYAYNGTSRIGKLNLYVYAPKEREVVIVPLTGGVIDQAQLTSALNRTIGEANLELSFTITDQWNDTLFTSSKTIGLPEDVSLMSKYSNDMRDLRDAYFSANPNATKDAYYLFVVPSFSDANVDGYMVRGKALGFVRTGSNYLTYAHELAHGIGALEHSWKSNGPTQGTTDNLMDYSGATQNLTKAQWKELRDLDIAPSMWDEVSDFLALYEGGFFSKSEAGESVSINTTIDGIVTPSGFAIIFADSNQSNWTLSNVKYISTKSSGVTSFTLNSVNYTHVSFHPRSGGHTFGFYMKEDNWNELESLYPPDSYGLIEAEDIGAYIASHHEALLYWARANAYPNSKILSFLFNADSCAYIPFVAKRTQYGDLVDNPGDKFENGQYKAPLFGNYEIITTKDFETKFSTTFDSYCSNPSIITGALQFVTNDTDPNADLYCSFIKISEKKKMGSWFLNKYGFNAYYKSSFSPPGGSNLTQRDILEEMIEIGTIYDQLEASYFHRLEDPRYRAFFMEWVDLTKTSEGDTELEKIHAQLEFVLWLQANSAQIIAQIENSNSEDEIAELIITTLLTNEDLSKISIHNRIRILELFVTDWMWGDEERAALAIINSTKNSEVDELLEALIAKRSIYSWTLKGVPPFNSILDGLYTRIDGAENSAFVQILYNLWARSTNYTQSANYDYSNKLHVIDYVSTKSWGFYNSNYDFTRTPSFDKIYIVKEGTSDQMIYDAWQPIGLLNSDLEGEVEFSGACLPAFLLFTFDNVNGSANASFAAQITIDVLSTFIGGVGLVKHLRHLNKLSKISGVQRISIGIKTIEFTAGTANIVLHYSCDDNDVVCNKIQQFLTVLELSTLGGDIIYGKIAKAKAKKLQEDHWSEIDDPDLRNLIEEVVSASTDLLSRLNHLDLSDLIAKLEEIGSAAKTKFLVEFAGASDNTLITLNNNTGLVDYWKINGSLYRNRTYSNLQNVDWAITRNNILSSADQNQILILQAIENQHAILALSNSKPVMAGAYCPELGGNVVVKYNLTTAEKGTFNYNSLESEIKDHLSYMNLIRQDAIHDGNLYQMLYSGVDKTKLIAASEAASHAEVLAMNDVLKQMKLAGLYNSQADLGKISILVRGKGSYGNMCRCPHCFHLTYGVNMIGNN